MAIVQVSRITHRKGLTENLPQLAGAELGWAVDERRLFIGNGTLEEGAPVIGNTEILTEFSDVTALSTYTYKDLAVGYAAQTGATPSEPIVRTVQERLDDIATVRNFGAVGDGVTDDTAAINRALYELFCRQSNPQVRRSLFFPAGIYRVTDTIIIPSYARLIGEGAESSVIKLDASSSADFVARYGDTAQQTGADIGTNGAIAPQNIEIESMTFRSEAESNVFMIEGAVHCSFDTVNFEGSVSLADFTPPEGGGTLPALTKNIIAVVFDDVAVPNPSSIVFEKCGFKNSTYAFNTSSNVHSVIITNGFFDTLYQGVILGEGSVIGTGPYGFKIVGNKFDNIFAEGIIFSAAEQNASAYNLFLDVGNDFSATPTTPCITFVEDNNVSMYDMFSRTDSEALTRPRIRVLGSANGTGSEIRLGRYSRGTGKTLVLANNASDQTIATVNTNESRAFSFEYTLVRGSAVRRGVVVVVAQDSGDSALTLSYTDDYVENLETGITILVEQITDSRASVKYNSTNIGLNGTLTYSISHLA